MMREWIRIVEFPDYEVSVRGEIRSVQTGRILRPSLTGQGAVKINLRKDGITHTRSVAKIVAIAHVWNDSDPEIFDTPIHLDHDMRNNNAANLAWRPRWFAVKYQQQYWTENYRNNWYAVRDTVTGIEYPSLREPCQEFGLLFFDILRSCEKGEYVFPTWKVFESVRVLEKR